MRALRSDTLGRGGTGLLTRVCLVLVLACALVACGGGEASAATPDQESSAAQTESAASWGLPSFGKGSDLGTTDGAAYTQPTETLLSPASISASDATDYGTIDTSTVADGYVTVAVTNTERIKFQVVCGDMSYNYDVPGDGTPVTCPLNMGNGTYKFRVMQNTSGNNYVELNSEVVDVSMTSEFTAYLRPNVIVSYDGQSKCVDEARQIVASASNEGEALALICTYVIDHVSYDKDKAKQVANVTGYLPDPDETYATNKGICFDFAALGAAMLRSQGIPTRLMTGYVSPGDVYHAWISVYIDGSWHNVQFSVDPKTWTRVDLTFATGAGEGLVGDGKEYTDRYTY